MYIVDSNIVIYSEIPGFEYLREMFTNDLAYVSEITHLEVLGYHRISAEEELYYKDIFDLLPAISPTTLIFEKAIFLRKTHNMTLGDSIIAATALTFNLTLYTRNLKDFEKINGLNCINPIK